MSLRVPLLDRRRLTVRATRHGFTLPEILIVIVMISVLSIVAIPRFANANGKRHLESARMRVAAGLATARQAAIQKGRPVEFRIASHLVTVTDTLTKTNLISPVPLDVLYKVRTDGDYAILFSSRGFATPLLSATKKIMLSRNGVAGDSVVLSRTGMVQR